MTLFDLTLAALVLVGALWGMLRGALRQVGSATAWVGCIVVPWQLAGPLAHFAAGYETSTPFPILYLPTVLVLAALTQLVVRLAFGALRKAWLKRHTAPPPATDPSDLRRALDQSAGTLLGAITMALLLWLGLSLLALADEPLQERGVDLGMRDSGFVQLAGRYNAVALLFGSEIHRLDVTLRRMQAGARYPGHAHAFDAVSSDVRWRSIAHDDTLSRALMSGDVRVLKQSPVLSLLTDRRALDRAFRAASSAAR